VRLGEAVFIPVRVSTHRPPSAADRAGRGLFGFRVWPWVLIDADTCLAVPGCSVFRRRTGSAVYAQRHPSVHVGASVGGAVLFPDRPRILSTGPWTSWRVNRSVVMSMSVGPRSLSLFFGFCLAGCCGSRYPSRRRVDRTVAAFRLEGGGKSGLHRARCQVMPGGREPTESATENNRLRVSAPVRVKRCGKSAPHGWQQSVAR
jgi:hypothetical protein